MQNIPVTKAEVLPTGELTIYPGISSADFQYIYRAAVGVYWDAMNGRFHHNFDGYDAKTLSHADWYKHIVSVLRNEMGLDLILETHTQWVNISNEQKNKIITE